MSSKRSNTVAESVSGVSVATPEIGVRAVAATALLVQTGARCTAASDGAPSSASAAALIAMAVASARVIGGAPAI